MSTVGIIAEYNPFHTGHAYHIRKAKELTGADHAVIIMSGDFVQRGEPAIFDKYTRARMALQAGADLVLELPVCYATGSAEYFAQGAVTLLDQLHIADYLCFGAETADTGLFQLLARTLCDEPDAFRTVLRQLLKEGRTYPQARAAALSSFLSENCTGYSASQIQAFLSSPNNILGIEYCRALLACGSSVRPVPLTRKESDYSSSALCGTYCSATAIRRAIEKDTAPELILSYIPAANRPLFLEAARRTARPDDFLPFLNQQLLSRTEYMDILDISQDLSDRIAGLRFSCIGSSFDDIVAGIRTKQMTESRIRRALLHLILQLSSRQVEAWRADGMVYYARLLGLRRDASFLAGQIKKRSTLPLITKTSCASSVIPKEGTAMWEKDVYASHLYRSTLSIRYQMPFRTEYEISPVIISS